MTFDGKAVVDRAGTDPEFLLSARGWTGSVRLEVGPKAWTATILSGKLVSFEQGGAGNADIVIAGPEHVWSELLTAKPKPGYTDIFTASSHGMQVEGDPVEAIGPYYPAVKRLIGILREIASGPQEIAAGEYPLRQSDVTQCRYLYVDVDGIEYRIFVQEAGEGIPLLLQHGEGGDSRQWRHLLADPELQKKFRMIAYDLPFHGKSMPPGGVPWWKSEYRTSTDALMRQAVAISEALELDRPIFMGCSLGGRLAVHLAAHHADKFSAFVAINGLDAGTQPERPDALVSKYFRHPRINEAYFAAILHGRMSPHAPERMRREAEWIATTSGLGVFKGDHDYLTCDRDLRKDALCIDARRTPLWIVAGEYGCDGGVQALASEIPGAELTVLPALGPFMMSEDPLRFRQAIIPILDEVSGRIPALA